MRTTMAVTAAEIRLECDACGQRGRMTRETGPVEERAADWMLSHLTPRIVAVRVIDTLTGTHVGWWRLRA